MDMRCAAAPQLAENMLRKAERLGQRQRWKRPAPGLPRGSGPFGQDSRTGGGTTGKGVPVNGLPRMNTSCRHGANRARYGPFPFGIPTFMNALQGQLRRFHEDRQLKDKVRVIHFERKTKIESFGTFHQNVILSGGLTSRVLCPCGIALASAAHVWEGPGRSASWRRPNRGTPGTDSSQSRAASDPMPKTVMFDIEHVLTGAMHVFWSHGYRATTMRALADATGIGSGSIYNTFGGKRGLFLEALRHYDRVYREVPLSELVDWPSPRQAVIAVFEGAVAAVLEDGSQDGCMEVNIALELSPHDEEVAIVVARAFAGMEVFLRDAIERGQACGEISGEKDPGATARALLALFLGLRVLARSRPEEELLRDVARQAELLLH